MTQAATEARTRTREAPFADALLELRGFMFRHVYLGPVAAAEKGEAAARVRELLSACLARPELVPDGDGADATRAVDWIAGMTDRYCIRVHEQVVRAGAPAA